MDSEKMPISLAAASALVMHGSLLLPMATTAVTTVSLVGAQG